MLTWLARHPVSCAAFVAALGAALWVAFVPAGPRSLGRFDPERVAASEVAMWQAYYEKRNADLARLLVLSLREIHGYTWADATRSGFYLARAAAHFARMRGDYDRVLPDLENGYTVLKRWTGAGFDVRAVARAELAWWVARRTPGENGADNVGRLIGEEYCTLYGAKIDRPRAMQAGLLRAEAAKLRDDSARAPDWAKIRSLLVDSYRSLHSALTVR